MFLPAAGCIAPGTARNRVGLLPAQQRSAAGSVRARGGYLQRRGASSPCSFYTILLAGAQGQNRPVPGSDRSRPPSVAIGVGPRMQESSALAGKSVACVFVELFVF